MEENREESRIKWWKVKDATLRIQFKANAVSELRSKEDANEWHEEISKVTGNAGEESLGKSSGEGPPLLGKETWE